MFETPVLFLIFNRPESTFRVFERIKALQPKALYIAADGPRQAISSDKENCRLAREIVNLVDWDCELKTLVRDSNLGCGIGVSDAIMWFFNHVEEGIILEDDCLPDSSFFAFCEELLRYYRNNEKIMHIGGTNFQDAKKRYSESYYFSSIAHVWGWATWKRAWDKYNFNIEGLEGFIKSKKINYYYADNKIVQHWLDVFSKMERHEIDTWDHQWTYSIWKNNGLTIIPSVNLVSNIGFDENATHTKGESEWANMPTHAIDSIRHPLSIIQDKEADIYTFYRHYSLPEESPSLFKRILNRIA